MRLRPVHFQYCRWLDAVIHDNVQAMKHVLTHPGVLATARRNGGNCALAQTAFDVVECDFTRKLVTLCFDAFRQSHLCFSFVQKVLECTGHDELQNRNTQSHVQFFYNDI